MYGQNSVTSNDVTGIAALDPAYVRKAQQIQGMPIQKQIETLLDQGIDPSTAMLVIKARKLKDIAAAGGGAQANQTKVSQDIDRAFQEVMARRSGAMGGLAALPTRPDMYSTMDTGEGKPQGYAKGGIVAFQTGGMPQGNPNPGMYGQQQIDRAAANAIPTPYGPNIQGPYSSTSIPATPADAGSEIDPALVAQYYRQGLTAGTQSDDIFANVYANAGVGAGSDIRDITNRINKIDKEYLSGKHETREEAQARAKKQGEDVGVNKGEFGSIDDNAKTLEEYQKYAAQAQRRGLIKAGKAIEDLAERESEKGINKGNPFQQALKAFIAGGTAYSEERDASDRMLMDAKIKLRQADREMQINIAKNNLGLTQYGDKQYEEDVRNRNDAQKRIDELVKARSSLENNNRNTSASIKANAALQAAYARNPGAAYEARLQAMQAQRNDIAASDLPDAAKRKQVASMDEAIRQFKQQRAEAVGATPQVTAAQLRAANAKEIAQLQAATKERVAGMGAKDLQALRISLGSLKQALAANPGDTTLEAMVNAKEEIIRSREQELGIASSPSTGDPSRRISVVGVERVQ